MKLLHMRNILFAFILLFLVTACGSSQDSSPDSAATPSEEADDETYDLTYNIIYNSGYLADSVETYSIEDEPKYVVVEMFADKVREATDGRVNIEFYWSNQLVPQDQMMDALASGTIDLGNAAPYYYGDVIETAEAFNLPFMSQGTEHVKHLLRETEFSEIYERELEEYGVKNLFYWAAGDQGIMSEDPIRTVEDMNGQSFRIEGGLHGAWYDDMGTAPVNVAAAEQYEALQRGTIDGTVFPYYTIESYKFHEVVDYMTMPGIFNPVIVSVFISMDTWNELPEDLQEIIEEVAMEMENRSFEASERLSEESIRLAEENGVEVIQLDEEELNRFIESSQIVWDELAAKNDDLAQMIDILRETMEE